MIKREANIHVAYADGHQIVRKGIVNLINSFDHIVVDSDVDDGRELIDKIGSMNKPPDICIVDLNMPVSNGFQTIHEVNKRWPKMKKIGFSIDDDHFSLIKLIQNGADGHVIKNAAATLLESVLNTVYNGGFFYKTTIDSTFIRQAKTEKIKIPHLTEKERLFLFHCCSDLSYPQIADKMQVSVRSVDWYRDSLFKKLNVYSRSSLVLYAVKLGLMPIEPGSLSWMLG